MNESKAILGLDRRLVIALVAILVLAVVWVFVLSPLLLGGEESLEPIAPVAAASEAVPTEEPTLEATEELPPIDETFEVFSARDPFQQLVSDVEEAPVLVTDPAVDAAPGATEEPVVGDPASNPPASTTEGGTTVEVDDVFDEDGTDYVLLRANDTVYTLAEGEDFASNWRVEAIDDPCVTLLFGDQARLVCEGESIRK